MAYKFGIIYCTLTDAYICYYNFASVIASATAPYVRLSLNSLVSLRRQAMVARNIYATLMHFSIC